MLKQFARQERNKQLCGCMYRYQYANAMEPAAFSTSNLLSKRFVSLDPELLLCSILRQIHRVLQNKNRIIVWETGCNVITG